MGSSGPLEDRAERESPEDAAEKQRWERLVAAIAAGERVGQEALYVAFGRGLHFYFARHLRAEDIDDKVHDTFLAVVTALRTGGLREPQRLPGLVRTVAQRQVAGYIAESVRRRSEVAEFSSDTPSPCTGDPDHEILLRQRRELARKFLEELPEIDRQILVRFYFEEQSPEQICEHLRISQTQFRLRKNRAKERISEMMRKAVKRRKLFGEFLMRKQAAAGH